MGLSNMTLVKIGAIGGMITVSMGFALRQKLNNQIKQTEYYKDALHTVRKNRGAIHLLGEPIKDGNVDVGNSEENFTKTDTAQYVIPIRGSKQKGTIYFWARKDNNNDKWNVNRIELELENEPNRFLLIKNDE